MYWRNSNFQYAYFIFGACHTAIEAHRKCMEAVENREAALAENENAKSPKGEFQARQLRASVDQAHAELDFLNECRKKLESFIGRVPTMDDYQSNQREEWRLELEFRAENYLLTSNTIPPDHFATMRLHPDFPQILDKIGAIRMQLQNGQLPELNPPQWRQEIVNLIEVADVEKPALKSR